MSFREVRLEILEEHRLLRTALADVETLRSQLEAGDGSGARALLESGRSLYQRFAAHLAHEDRALVPAVGAIAGPAVADKITKEHREQRVLLEYLLGQIAQPERPAVLLAQELQQFATLLEADMREEEALLLRLDESSSAPAV
jgi:hemerythrin-like domain-containing protein